MPLHLVKMLENYKSRSGSSITPNETHAGFCGVTRHSHNLQYLITKSSLKTLNERLQAS